MASALILFAHGSRDPHWAAPFERILARVQAGASERSPMLAFLELMQPDLEAAIATQVARGCTAIRVVPLFLGLGGHLRHDVPALVDKARAAHPGVTIDLAAPAGEDDGVTEALAAYCMRESLK